MGCGQREFARLLEGSFLGDLSLDDWERLRAHLAGCEVCRTEYDRQVRLQRAMSREAGPLPSESLERIGEAVLARVAVADQRARAIGSRRWWKAAFVAAPVGALAVLLALVVPRGTDPFQARSSGQTQIEGVRAFCIAGDGGAARIRSSTDFTGTAELRCRQSDALQLSYTSGPNGGWLTVVSVPETGEGELLEYVEAGGEGLGVQLEPSRVDEPLPYSTRLQVRHGSGTRILVALFGERALTRAELEAAARAVAAGRTPDDAIRVARSARLFVE